MRITRRLEFDAGHRIPNHASQCRHLHGHRYAIEVTVSGEIVAAEGDSEQGMVADFAGIKALLHQHIVEPWEDGPQPIWHSMVAPMRGRIR